MSFERSPKNLRFGTKVLKVKNRDYKVAVSTRSHLNRRFSENQKQLASIFDGLLLMLVF